jgi:hypothetical protein
MSAPLRDAIEPNVVNADRFRHFLDLLSALPNTTPTADDINNFRDALRGRI